MSTKNKRIHKGIYTLVGVLGLSLVVILSFVVFKQAAVAEDKVLNIKTWQTKNDVPVYFVSSKQLPMIDIVVLFDAGSRRDGEKPGLAYLTSHLLNKGTAKLDANKIAQSFDEVGAIYSASVGRDKAAVSLRSLSDAKYLSRAVDTFADVMSRPLFPEADFLRLQQQTLMGLKQEQQEPGSIASRSFFSLLYNQEPYAHSVNGSDNSISALNVAALKRFYKEFYVADNAMIILVGDLPLKKAKQVADHISENLSSGKKAPKLAQAKLNTKALTSHVDFPSEQTHVVIGQVAIDRLSPDYFALQLGNHVLGGGAMTSRLFDEVREKRGLAYSVGSHFEPLKNRGPFSIVLQTRSSEAENAIKLVQTIMSGFLEKGPTEKELTVAKKNIIGSFPLYFASNSGILSNVANIAFYDLPLDYLDTYRERMSEITASDIQKAFQKHLALNHLAIVTVGQSAANG